MTTIRSAYNTCFLCLLQPPSLQYSWIVLRQHCIIWTRKDNRHNCANVYFQGTFSSAFSFFPRLHIVHSWCLDSPAAPELPLTGRFLLQVIGHRSQVIVLPIQKVSQIFGILSVLVKQWPVTCDLQKKPAGHALIVQAGSRYTRWLLRSTGNPSWRPRRRCSE